MKTFKTIRADLFKNVDRSDGIVLDVRTKMEHLEKRLDSSHAHVALDQLNPSDFMMRHGLDRDSKVYILCRSGARAAQAAEKFLSQNYHNIYVVEGGLLACEESGHSLKGHGVASAVNSKAITGPISLERQVRITAGVFILLGTLLGLWLNHWYLLIPALVGTSLIFAGITDWCAAALVLTKAPWNKSSTGTTSVTKPTQAIEGTCR